MRFTGDFSDCHLRQGLKPLPDSTPQHPPTAFQPKNKSLQGARASPRLYTPWCMYMRCVARRRLARPRLALGLGLALALALGLLRRE